jgi:4-azaleucine resistance transporter AzlC
VTASVALEQAARRSLATTALGITVSAAAFGLVYGMAARDAGFSVIEALAMSVFVLAGATQFAAVGLVVSGVPWIAIVVLTLFLNARHVLYGAALAPWLHRESRRQRAAMAHVLTDETFAIALPHFQRLGRSDVRGYWLASCFICLPWIAATVVGHLASQHIPDPTRFGLDVVFPAAMAGLTVGLVGGRRDVAAAVAGGLVAVSVGLVVDPALGIIAGGLLGPLVALAVPSGAADAGQQQGAAA